MRQNNIINGDLIITKGDKEDYSHLTEVSGYVDVQEGATFTAPALAKSGYVYVQEGATFTAPALAEVSGSVDVRQGATFTAPALAKSGYVDVRQGATFTAPALAEVSGYVDVQEGATFTAPALAELFSKIGYKNLHSGNFPPGVYLTLNEKEVGYLIKLKPIIEANRLYMGHWHQNDSWKTQSLEKIIHECNTTHCVAGWIQIFEKDKYNNLSPEEAGAKCAPNLAHIFHSDEALVEKIVKTLLG